jgi:ubiquinone/menaquinone biosynthesis C-methylase UbiE
MGQVVESQSLSVKRAQVEFHNFASLGEPERAFRIYAEENRRRGAIIQEDLDFIGELSPFLEIGANAGHTSYMLANQFGADGYALDISADALRHGVALMDPLGFERAPVRLAGDALNLPFRDGSLKFVMTCQTLSQFLDLEAVFKEVSRVLAPGGTFLFCEEPIRRLLSLRLYRCPYYESMKPWERKLFDWGLLGYLVKDVIGAEQEESFGIRQNHTMGLKEWQHLIQRHFADQRYHIFVTKRGWGERIVRDAAVQLDPYHSEWRAARLLGGTLASSCKKSGQPDPQQSFDLDKFESLLRCPDCSGSIRREESGALQCKNCTYRAEDEGGVYNLIRSHERNELYPGDREDTIDFSRPAHESSLIGGFHQLEGSYGNKFRWIGGTASARLKRHEPGPQQIRIRGHAPQAPVEIKLKANGQPLQSFHLDRTGLFILEADLPDAPGYLIEITASPVWTSPGDPRPLSVTISMLRLVRK